MSHDQEPPPGRLDHGPLKRVLHLRGSSAILGAESVVLELAKHSREFDYEPIVATINDPEDPPSRFLEKASSLGIATADISCRGRLDLSLPRRLGKFVVENNISLIHSHGYKEDFYALWGASALPKVATNHLWKRMTPALIVYSVIDVLCLRYFDHVVGVSRPIVAEMKRLGIRPEKLSLIPNGVDVDQLGTPPSSDRIRLLRSEFRISGEDIVVGVVASLSREKGHRFLLEAVSQLYFAAGSIKLLFIGEGEERKRLKELAGRLGLQERVIFAGTRGDIRDVLHLLDIFILPSLKEGLPMALLEAMACSRAVVATCVGEVPEVIEDGVSGVLVEPGSAAALAAALRQLLSSTELRSSLGQAAREVVAKRFSSRTMTEYYCRLYTQVLGS